jgi:hypothetical protein
MRRSSELWTSIFEKKGMGLFCEIRMGQAPSLLLQRIRDG